jgi:hypothetical protein
MRSILILAGLAAVIGGCASEPAQVAQADCKVAPYTPKSAVNKPGTYSELDRRWAEAHLRNSDVRRNSFDRAGLSSPIEQAIDDCAKR